MWNQHILFLDLVLTGQTFSSFPYLVAVVDLIFLFLKFWVEAMVYPDSTGKIFQIKNKLSIKQEKNITNHNLVNFLFLLFF